MKLFGNTIKNSEKVEIYNREFQQRYNFGFYKQAEEIARKNDLGKLINDEQLMIMAGISLDKTIDNIKVHFKNLKEGAYQGKERDIYKKCDEEFKIIDYWQKILNKKGLAKGDYWIRASNKVKELN
jgi:hypothetical protein